MDLIKMKRLAPRLALTVLSVLLAAGGLWFALTGFQWAEFRRTIFSLDARWLALAVIFDVMSYGMQGLRWNSMLVGSSAWKTTRAIYAGLFVNEIAPLRPGEVLRVWMAARDLGVQPWIIAPTVIAERLMDGVWLAVALLAAVAVAPLPRVLYGAIGLMSGAAVLAGLVAWFSRRTKAAMFRDMTKALKNRTALVYSGTILLAQGLAFWAVIRASHLSLGITAALVVMVAVRLGTLLPGAPANVGTHQFATVMGLSIYGVAKHDAAAFAVVLFAVLTLPLMFLGSAAFVSAGVSWRSLRQTAEDPEYKSTAFA